MDVLSTLSLVNAAELRELTATVFKTYLVRGSESVSEAMAEAGRIYHESAGAIKSKPEAERADAQEQLNRPYVHVGGVPAQSGGDEGAGTRTRGGVEVVLGEQRGEERTSAAGGACTALSSEAVQENRGQGRLDAYRVLSGPGHSPSRGSVGSSTAAAERGEEVRPRPKRPPRARSIEAPNTDAREVERLAHRVEQYSLHMAGLLRRGGTVAFDGVCLPNDEGRTAGATAQIQGQSSGTKSRNDE